MCGMIIFLNTTTQPLSKMRAALASIAHRGEVGRTNMLEYGDRAYGHTRLAIRGLDHQYDQPLITGNGVGLFVGEVFNTPPGVENDADYALRQAMIVGPGVAREFDGFFSMAYTRGKRLYVQTDHLGIKPLYYDMAHGVIASELHAIAACNPQDPDELYFSAVTKWGYDVTDRTAFLNVRRIAPGTVLEFDEDGLYHEYQYWKLRPVFHSLDIALRNAVTNRLVSDIPVASLCSGGLDSTIVTLLANKVVPDLQVFHIDNGENHFFNLVEEQLSPEATVTRLVLDTQSVYEAAVRAADTPVDLGSVLPQYALASAVAAAGVSVVLSGDGADELFGGYRRAQEYDSQLSDVFQELPAYHLPRLDALMMSHTIELRSPFLAPKVIETALALPYKSRTTKQALKQYFCDLIPGEILKREKVPLRTPAVALGGTQYRREFIETWRRQVWP
jgi:asparagine synthase (glutamine-hydrolysing)